MHYLKVFFSRFVIVMLTCSLVLGCQPTPEREMVASKTGEKTEHQLIFNNDTRFDYAKFCETLPEKWEDSLSLRNGTVNVSIAADIVYPAVEAIAVVEVAPKSVTMETIEGLMNYIVDHGYLTISEENQQNSSVYTQEEVEAWIDEVKAQLSNVDKYYIDNPNLNKEELVSDLEAELSRLMEMLKRAKPSSQQKVTDYSALTGTSRVEGTLHNDNNLQIASVLIKACGGASDDKRESQLLIRSTDNAKVISEIPVNTIEQAVEICNQIITELGLGEEYTLVSVRDRKDEVAFGLYYGRVYKGIKHSPLVEREIAINEQYQVLWPEERIEFCIGKGDQFFKQVSWRGNSSIVQDLVSNAELYAFDSVKEACKSGLSSILAWRAEDIKQTQVVINNMMLGYSRVAMKDEDNRYMLIPTWSLTGEVINERIDSSNSTIHIETEDLSNDVVLVISAIDGSIIYGGMQS